MDARPVLDLIDAAASAAAAASSSSGSAGTARRGRRRSPALIPGRADRVDRRVLGRGGVRASSGSRARSSTPLSQRRAGALRVLRLGGAAAARDRGWSSRGRRRRRGRLRAPPARSATPTPSGSGSRRRTTCGSRAGSRATARTRAAPGRTSGCRPRTATSSATTRSAARTSSSTADGAMRRRGRRAAGAARRAALSARASPRAKRLLERRGGRPARERPSVDRDDGHHLPDRRRREHLVGGEQALEREHALDDLASPCAAASSSSAARVSPARMPTSSDGVRSTSPSRHQMFVTGPSSTMPSRVDEDGVVGAAGLRLGLGGDADGVARRLRRRQQPRRRPPLVEQRDEPLAPRARRLDPGRDRADERDRAVLAAGRPRRPVEPQHRLGRRRLLERERRQLLDLGAVRRLEADPLGRAREPVDVLLRTGTAGRRRRASSRTPRGHA